MNKPSYIYTLWLLLLRLPWMKWRNHWRTLHLDSILKAIVLLSFGIGVAWAEYELFHRFLKILGQVPFGYSLVLTRLLNLVGSFLFAFLVYSSLLTTLSALYRSDDLYLIIIAPVKKSAILLTKWFEVGIRSSITLLFLALPPMVAAGRFFTPNASFYLIYLTVLLSVSAIAISLGMALGMTLIRCFPAKRLHQTVAIIGLCLAVLMITGLRFLHLETLWSNAAKDNPLIVFLQTEAGGYLQYAPGRLFAWSVVPFLLDTDQGIVWLMASIACGIASLLLVLGYGYLVFEKGWWKFQESMDPAIHTDFNSKPKRWMKLPGSKAFWGLMWKDKIITKRDPSIWTQLFMMVPLAALYLMNLSFLPLKSEELSPYFAVANLGFIALILSAVGARFLFPSASREGKSIWIFAVSPAKPGQLMLQKIFFALPPVMLLSLAMLLLSSWILQVGWSLILWLSVYGINLTLQLSFLAITLGFCFPQFEYRHLLEVSLGRGAFLFMILSLAFIVSLLYLAIRILLYESVISLTIFHPYFLAWSLCGLLINLFFFEWGRRKIRWLEDSG